MFFHNYSLAVEKHYLVGKKNCQKTYVNLQTKFLTVCIKGGNTEYHKRGFSYLAAKDWNEIHFRIQRCLSSELF